MSTNGGASMVVTGSTNAVQQQAMVDQIVYNAQNNIPFALTSAPGDSAGAAIAQNIMTQAQSMLAVGASPTVANQVSASTTGSNPASSDWFGQLGQGASSTLAGGAAGAAASGAGNSVAANAAGGGAASPSANLGATSTLSPIAWLQANVANYGLVIMGALLVLGALLISQRQNIQTAVTTAAKVAAV